MNTTDNRIPVHRKAQESGETQLVFKIYYSFTLTALAKQMKDLSNLALASLNHSTIKIAECILYWTHSITLDVTGKKNNKQTIKQPKSNKKVIFSISGDKILEIFSVYGICFNFLKSFLNDKLFDFPLIKVFYIFFLFCI